MKERKGTVFSQLITKLDGLKPNSALGWGLTIASIASKPVLI